MWDYLAGVEFLDGGAEVKVVGRQIERRLTF